MTITMERITGWSDMTKELFEYNPIIGCMIVFILLDILTGLVAAIRTGELASRQSYCGMMSKAQMLLVVTAAKFSEFIIAGGPWGNIVAGFFCITELTSIIENAGRAGVPIPQSWMDAMSAFRKKEENKPVVEVHTEIHTEKRDVEVRTTQETGGIPGLKPKVDKTPSDKICTVVKMTDSQVLNPSDMQPPGSGQS